MKKIKYIQSIAIKMKGIVNLITQQNNKTLNKIINNKNIDNPILALKEIENIIIFLLNSKKKQKKLIEMNIMKQTKLLEKIKDY